MKVHINFGRLKPNSDLYPDELVNARLRPRTSKKHLHLAGHRLAWLLSMIERKGLSADDADQKNKRMSGKAYGKFERY